MPHILLASYHFPPSSAVGARRPARIARLLPEFGYEVDVVCASAENAAAPSDPSQWSLVPDESRVRRIDTPFVFGRNPSHAVPTGNLSQRVWWKARTYAEWLFVTHDWSWNWGGAAVDVLAADPETEQAYDLLLVDGPPRPAIVPFVRWANRLGIPIVVDLRDSWAFDEEPVPGRLDLRPNARRLRWGLRLREEAITAAAHIVLSSPEGADLMRGRFPALDGRRFSCIPNAFAEVDEMPQGTADRGTDRVRLVYTGSLAYGRLAQVEALIQGMGELRRRGGAEVELVVVGHAGESLGRIAEAEGVADRVETVEWMARDDAIRLQREANTLLLLQPSANADVRVAVPAKLFEYMERRRNIFGLVGRTPAARIIDEHALGVVSVGEDPDSIADALQRLSKCVGERPFLAPPPESYSERATVTEFAELLDGILTARMRE